MAMVRLAPSATFGATTISTTPIGTTAAKNPTKGFARTSGSTGPSTSCSKARANRSSSICPPTPPMAPCIAPEEDTALYRDKPERPAGFFGMITNFDTNMGRLMAFLEREGLSANTILIYTSDNGSACGMEILQCRHERRQNESLRWRTPRALLHPLAARRSRGRQGHRPTLRAPRRLADTGRSLRTEAWPDDTRWHEPGPAIDVRRSHRVQGRWSNHSCRSP